MLAASTAPRVAYLWEPFSVLHRAGICDARFVKWFPYICQENEGPYRRSIGDMLAFHYKGRAELRALRSTKDVARMARDWLHFAWWRSVEARPLLKDPIAVFSAGWLCDTFDMDVIVLVRHPAAFANSLIRRGLRHPFDHFLNQPLLMQQLLEPFEGQIRAFAEREQSILDQAVLLWNLIHHVILRYQEQRARWMFLRLEDIACEPQSAFHEIYGSLGLTFDQRVRETIAEYSDPSNPVEDVNPASSKRHSRASIVTWKSRLTPKEIDRIRVGVEPISSAFYSDSDW